MSIIYCRNEKVFVVTWSFAFTTIDDIVPLFVALNLMASLLVHTP